MLKPFMSTSIRRMLSLTMLQYRFLSSSSVSAFVGHNKYYYLGFSRQQRLSSNYCYGLFHTSSSLQAESRSTPETIRQESMEEMDQIVKFFATSTVTTTTKPKLLKSHREISEYIDENFDSLLFDCDGVLYRGADVIPNGPECLQSLMKRGKKIFFVTNNAASSRKQLRDKLAKFMNCPDLKEEQMIGSAYSASRYLMRELLLNKKEKEENKLPPHVHVIGTEGLCEEIRNAGFIVSGGPGSDDPSRVISAMSRDDLESYEFLEDTENGIDAVVIGLDTAFDYRKLCIAVVLLQRYPNALLVATNKDSYDLVGADARHLPGNGALVAAVEAASERTAIVTGKPSPILADLISEEHGLNPTRTLMVGDRLDTDIRFGLDGGMSSALVLTGCTTAEKIMQLGVTNESKSNEPMPTVIFPHMGLMSL